MCRVCGYLADYAIVTCLNDKEGNSFIVVVWRIFDSAYLFCVYGSMNIF